MKYFVILANVASIAGFGASLVTFSPPEDIHYKGQILIIVLLITVSFWLYFYFRPLNKLARNIDRRVDYTGKYLNTLGEDVDVLEGAAEIDTTTWDTLITLPPFEEPPKIVIINRNGIKNSKAPDILDVTTESFRMKISDSRQFGLWRWRARGKLLQLNEKHKPSKK